MAQVADRESPRKSSADFAFFGEMVIGSVLIAVFGYMFYHSLRWEEEAALFPRLIALVGIVFTTAYLVQQAWRRQRGEGGKTGRILDIGWTKVGAGSSDIKQIAVGSVASAGAFWIGIVLVGFHVAAPIYLYSQLVIFGKMKRWIAALGAGAILAVIVLVYDQLGGTTWNDPVLWSFVEFVFSS